MINLLELIKIWNAEAIRNQEQLKKENETFEFPQWNKGYLACLEDLKGIIKENS